MNESIIDDELNDDELDKEIEAQIKQVTNRSAEEVDTSQQETVEKKEESQTTESSDKSTDTSTSQEGTPKESQETTSVDDGTFKTPTKGKNESDIAYQKRVELAQLVYKRKTAKDDSEVSQIQNKISDTRQELKKINSENFNRTDTPNNESTSSNAEAQTTVPVERLIEEGINAYHQNLQTKQVLETFVNSHKQLSDPDFREVFFDFIDSDFNWQGKSPEQLSSILTIAFNAMVAPEESFEDRVVKSSKVQEVIKTMNFEGGSVAQQGFSKERESQIAELQSAGMSREKAIELSDPD